MSEWRRTSGKSPWREKVPYDECPNCGRHKFRTLRTMNGVGILSFFFGTDKQYLKYEACKNCKYKTDRWTEDVE